MVSQFPLARKAGHLRDEVADAIARRAREARRLTRRGLRQIEDGADNARHVIKRRPLMAVVGAFFAGAVAAAAGTLFFARRGRRS